MNNNDNNSKKKKIKWKEISKKITKLPKIIKYSILVVIVIAILVIGIGTNRDSQTQATKFGLRDVGELVTQTAYVTEVKDTKESRDFFKLFNIPFTESRQIFSYNIEVDASVDFSKISYKETGKNEITVELPHSKIYKATLKTDSLKVYLDDDSLFSRIDLKEHNKALKSMEDDAIKTAKANGLLEAADKNAKVLIESFIKSDKKYKEYIMKYKYIGD